MTESQMKEYLIKKYNDITKALNEAEEEYNSNRRSVKKREIYAFVAAQQLLICDILIDMGIEYDDGLGD